MLNEIVRWMSERKVDRRTADRKKAQFPIAWLRGDEHVPGIGTEISINGLLFATKTAPPAGSFNVMLELGGRRMRARLATARTETAAREGVTWTLLACTFEGIAADDYDAVVRYIRELPEPDNKAQGELAAAAQSGDDAYRLLPMSVQKLVVETLIKHGRLAAGADARNPLLRMKYVGSKNGRHRFAVHSRVAAGDEIRAFDSAFTVDDNGAVALDR